jgi:Uma2 family endonuclease
MDTLETDLHPPQRRLITVDEFYRMNEAGIFARNDRVELIEGELIDMAPIGDEHSNTVDALNTLLIRAIGDRAIVSIQSAVRLGDRNVPQPDVIVFKPHPDFQRGMRRIGENVLLIIEVAVSSLAFDRAVKLPLYARHAIPEYWIVQPEARVVEVYRSPGADGYAEFREVRPGQTLTILALPDLAIPADRVLGTG